MYKKLTTFLYTNLVGKKSDGKKKDLTAQNEPPYYNTVNNKITQQPSQATYSNVNNQVNPSNMYSNVTEIVKTTNKNTQRPLYDNMEFLGKDDLNCLQSPVSSSYAKHQKPTIYKDDTEDYRSSSSQTSIMYKQINAIRPSNKLSTTYSMSNSFQPITKHEYDTKVENLKLVNDGQKKLKQNTYSFNNYNKCAKCNRKIMEGFGCIAMDNMFHIKCFTCTRCGEQLQGQPFYHINEKPYCKKDYFETLEKCSICNIPMINRFVKGSGRQYHPDCFRCVICFTLLDGIPFTIDTTNQIYCIEDYQNKFAPKCSVCRLPIIQEPGQKETLRFVSLDRSFHLQCFKCEDCDTLLGPNTDDKGCYPLDDHVLCKDCNAKRIQDLTSTISTEV